MSAALQLQRTASQRLLTQGVVALTEQMARSLLDRDQREVRRMMADRHRMLRDLGFSVCDDDALGCLAAMTAAVNESDMALEALLRP